MQKVLFLSQKSFIEKNVDKILVQSKSFVPLIKRFKIDSDRIIFLPNTATNLIVDNSYVENFKQTNNIQHGNFNIFFTGNLGESQALLDIIKVAKKTKTSSKIKWYFVGHGIMLEKLKMQ